MKIRRSAAVAAASVAVLALAACGEHPDGPSAGQKLDSAVSRTSDVAGQATDSARRATAGAAGTAKEAVGSAASSARDPNQQARNEARTSVMGAAADTRQSGAGAGPAAAGKVDDAQITSRVSASLMGDKDLSAIRIDVDTRDGVVTLSGPVPSTTAKARANEIAWGVKDVKSVNNQLTLSAS